MGTNLKELRLIQQAQGGHSHAFTELIQPYQHRVYALALHKLNHPQEAEDIVQETVLRVYVHLNRYKQPFKFSTWVFRIATNLCIDRLRKRIRTLSLDAPVSLCSDHNRYPCLADRNRTPEEVLLEQEEYAALRDAMEKLPSHYRSVLFLRYMKEMTLSDIGKTLKIPVTTVKSRVHRGRKALKSHMATSG